MADTQIADALTACVTSVTRKWTKQKRREERSRSASLHRLQSLRSTRTTIKEAAWHYMAAAYMKASANNTLPAHARQVFYAKREEIQSMADNAVLHADYFTQTLLPEYIRDHPTETADWDVVYDDRGHLTEPHDADGKRSIGLGTLSVRAYLRDTHDPTVQNIRIEEPEIHTHGPVARYGAILFIEKEGFMPLFRAVSLAERYDIAIMSTKGMSNTASRTLIEGLCSRCGLRLFVLHDFDKSGFSIVGTLMRDTGRYEWAKKVEVVDLGIRLEDIDQYNLPYERYRPRGRRSDIEYNLRENGATDEEIEVLLEQRVELNAFTSNQLVEWIESELDAHGVSKVIPDDWWLTELYRTAYGSAYLWDKAADLIGEADDEAGGLDIPADLRERVTEMLKTEPTKPWDRVVKQIADRDFRHRNQEGGIEKHND